MQRSVKNIYDQDFKDELDRDGWMMHLFIIYKIKLAFT